MAGLGTVTDGKRRVRALQRSRQFGGTTGQSANRVVNFLNFLEEMKRLQKAGTVEPTQEQATQAATTQAELERIAEGRKKAFAAQAEKDAAIDEQIDERDFVGGDSALAEFDELDPNVQAAVDVLGPEVVSELANQGLDAVQMGALAGAYGKHLGATTSQALGLGAKTGLQSMVNPQQVFDMFNRAIGYGVNVHDLSKDLGAALEGYSDEETGGALDAGSTREFVSGIAQSGAGTTGRGAYGGGIASKGMAKGHGDIVDKDLATQVEQGWVDIQDLDPATQQAVLAVQKARRAPKTGLGLAAQEVGDFARGYSKEDLIGATRDWELTDDNVGAAGQVEMSDIFGTGDTDKYGEHATTVEQTAKELADQVKAGVMPLATITGPYRSIVAKMVGQPAGTVTSFDPTHAGIVERGGEHEYRGGLPDFERGTTAELESAIASGAPMTHFQSKAPMTISNQDYLDAMVSGGAPTVGLGPAQQTEGAVRGKETYEAQDRAPGWTTGMGGAWAGKADGSFEGTASEYEGGKGIQQGERGFTQEKGGSDQEGETGRQCIIVTACTHPQSYEVNVTRKFRDECMTDSDLGGYYVIAHKVVPFLYKYGKLKDYTKKYLVDRLIDHGEVYFNYKPDYKYKTSQAVTRAFLMLCKVAGKLTKTDELLALHRG